MEETAQLKQFIIENILVTLLGTAIALILSAAFFTILNMSNVLPGCRLRINGNVLLLSFVVALGFALLSGVIPARRISGLQITSILKGDES